MGLIAGLSLYNYADVNPLKWIDPHGLNNQFPMPTTNPDQILRDLLNLFTDDGLDRELRNLEASAKETVDCIACEATCLFPVLGSDVAAEGTAQLMDKARQQARSAALAKQLGRTVLTFRSLSGVGTAAGVAYCTIECSDVCLSCR